MDEIKVAMLCEDDKIYFWRERHQLFVVCTLSLRRNICITDIFLNTTSIMLATKDGEAFFGDVKIKKNKRNLSNPFPCLLFPIGKFYSRFKFVRFLSHFSKFSGTKFSLRLRIEIGKDSIHTPSRNRSIRCTRGKFFRHTNESEKMFVDG